MVTARHELTRAWLRAQCLIDEKIGVLKSVSQIANPPGLPPMFRFRAVRNVLRGDDGGRQSTFSMHGYGFKSDPLAARMAAIGEAIERYCCTITHGHLFVESAYRDMQQPAVNPRRVSRPTAEQLQAHAPYMRAVDESSQLIWVEGREVDTDRSAWVPADLVFLPSPQRWSIREQISTGLACGGSYWHAVHAALCEAIERDAFTITWLMQLPMPRIDLSTVDDPGCKMLLERLDRIGVRVTVNDLTTNLGIPVFLVTAQTNWEYPRIFVSASASLDPTQALTDGLNECFGQLCFLLSSSRRVNSPSEIRDMHDHGFYHADGKCMDVFRFYLDSPIQRWDDSRWLPAKASTYEERVLALVERLRRGGCVPYAVDLTTGDVAQAGLHVVRVVVPELQFLHHAVPCLECPRMWHVAEAMGRPPAQPPLMVPHPFP